MSRNFVNASSHRDYGATSSTSSIIPTPDVNFSGFSPTEFFSLSENIAQNINGVKSGWQNLEKALKLIGTKRGTQATREKIHNIQEQTNTKIQITTKDLKRLSNIVRREDKQQKLQVEKLTSDFRTIVEKYSISQRLIATKMKLILTQSSNTQTLDDQTLNSALSSDEKAELLLKQQQVQSMLQLEQDIIKDRETRINEIETDILDVNSIMRELSTLVHVQGEQIDTIESSIDHSCAEAEAGVEELIKAARYRNRYRRKVLILLVIAVIIGLIVTGIIVSRLKS